MKRGLFIVFEGIDGCGKSTQIDLLAKYIYNKSKSNHILLTREPTNICPAGQKIREHLKNDLSPDEKGRLYKELFSEDRQWHVEIINNLQEKGIHVISDRYYYSTYTYQQVQGESFEDIQKAQSGFITPNITIIMDLPSEVSMQRLQNHDREEKEVFDKDQAYLEKIRETYLKLKEQLNENIVIIDATKTIQEIHQDVMVEIDKIIN